MARLPDRLPLAARDDEPFAEIERVRTTWASGELPDLEGVELGPRPAHDPSRGTKTLEAYRAWAERAGSQAAAFAATPGWTPQRRFERAFERLAMRGFDRGPRYELLVCSARLGVFDLRPWSLHLSTRWTRRRSPPSACSASATR